MYPAEGSSVDAKVFVIGLNPLDLEWLSENEPWADTFGSPSQGETASGEGWSLDYFDPHQIESYWQLEAIANVLETSVVSYASASKRLAFHSVVKETK